METMNMLMMLVVAAILFRSHHHSLITCDEGNELGSHHHSLVMCDEGNELGIWPWDISCYLPWPYPFPRPDACPPPRLRPPSPLHSPQPSPPPPAIATSCSTSDKEKMKTCMFNTTSIDECCPTFKSILRTSCPCYKYLEDLDNQVLITLEAYCDVNSPCRGVPSPPPPALATSCLVSDQEKVKTCMFNTTLIDECCPTFKSILGTSCPCYKYAKDLDNQVLSPPPPPPQPSCLVSDQEKVKTCMFNTTSIDECCPTFKSILGTSCPCYKYAEDLNNQVLITLEAYCDVNSPCKGMRSPLPPPPQPSCSASDQEKVKTCMFNTTSIDECCPTFQSILGTSCPCYKYGEDLDNQVLITLEAYCNVTSPCKGVQVINLSKDDE